MIEKYYNCKVKYNDYLIFIKSGSFYEVLEKDALILNSLVGYKIKRLSNCIKLGFPLSKIDDICNIVSSNKINYIIYNNELEIKEFKDNKYNSFNINIDKVKFNYIRIDKIINYLNDNITSNNIDILLSKIEALYE